MVKRSQTMLVGAVCGFILAFPPQIHEIYRAMAEAVAIGVDGYWIEPALASTAAVLLCWGIAYLDRCYGPRADGEAGEQGGFLLLVIASHLPLVGVAIGLYRARIAESAIGSVRSALTRARIDELVLNGPGTAEQLASIASRDIDVIMRFDGYLLYACYACLALALLSAGLLWAALRRFGRPSPGSSPSLYLPLSALVATAAFIILFATSCTRVVAARALTPVPVLAIALFLVGFWIASLTAAGRRIGIPIVTSLVVAAIVFSAFDLNDNHQVRTVVDPAPPARSTVREQLRAWLKGRTDLPKFAGKKYPIYIVAAQGGGIYAAYHAATFLGGVQDDCPRFGQHIFAISGVSGGSVGASVFASLLHQAQAGEASAVVGDAPCRKLDNPSNVFQRATTELLSKDYLTPLLGSFLFGDFLQQMLFFTVGPFDRARSLELGLEQSWDTAMASKQFKDLRGSKDVLTRPLSMPLTALWQPSSSPAPALLLNTTEVDTGRRRIVSPFTFDGIDASFLPIWSDIELERRFPKSTSNLPVSAAAFLSSRFPWITPAGFFEHATKESKQAEKVRVVDGGYFENSGIATALDLLSAMESAIDDDPELRVYRDKIQIDIITLNSKRFDMSSFSGFGEWLAPISAMMSTRSARAPLETSRAELLIARSAKSTTGIPKRLFRFDLDGLGYPLPLGWRLSPVTRLLIDDQLGTRSRCAAMPPSGGDISPDCLKKAIALQLGEE
jgi:hypothetical protein